MEAMRRHSFRQVVGPRGEVVVEDACSMAEVYAANTITTTELAKLRELMEIRERARRREAARQMHAEVAAMEWEASRGRLQADS